VAGKVTVGLSSHWPCLTNFGGLAFYRLEVCEMDIISTSPTFQWSRAACMYLLPFYVMQRILFIMAALCNRGGGHYIFAL